MQYAREVLFLDYDGVLHPQEVYVRPKRGIYLKQQDHKLFEHAELLVQLLEPYPELKVVLSTSWVRVKGYSFARKKLPAALQERVIGATYHSYMRYNGDGYGNGYGNAFSPFAQLSRYSQIATNLDVRVPHTWLAIDDDVEGWPENDKEWLVAPFDEDGIANPDVLSVLVEKLKRFSTATTPNVPTVMAPRLNLLNKPK